MSTGIVIVNEHEPDGEVAGRLLEIASEKGYDPTVVEAQRGEHDAGLSFRVPQDVADEFNSDRGDRWPDKIENADEMRPAAMNEDAYQADGQAAAVQTASNNATAEDNPNTPPRRDRRPGKATPNKE